MSFEVSCIPATKPRIESLNINEKTAVNAPIPLSKIIGLLPIRYATITIPRMIDKTILTTCKNPLIGLTLEIGYFLYISSTESKTALITNITTIRI
jgi:hypothetical protein